MTTEQLKAELIAHINEFDLSTVLNALAEIADTAAVNNPDFGFGQDAQAIRSIIPKIEN